MKAVVNDKEDVVRMLLMKGAKVNTVQSGKKSTAVCFAQSRTVAQLLIDSGADINTSACDSEAPVFLAFYRKKLEVVQTLLENGADGAVKDRRGHTLLNNAKKLYNFCGVETQLSSESLMPCKMKN